MEGTRIRTHNHVHTCIHVHGAHCMEPHKEQDTELWDKNSTLILLYMDKYNIYIYIYIYIYISG